ncbi:MAG TPA: hypothetical protein VGO24_02250 [Solirubrobacterales bacterium]|jgi:hypothetical protein|nr:hypothetical protein [Solirubrobacterales bacterium]
MVFSRTGLDTLADCLSGRYAALFGAAPEDGHAWFEDDVITFHFRGGLRQTDLALSETGRIEDLQRSRERFLDVVGAQLAAPVEAFARSHVAFHVGFFDPEQAATSLLFGFEEHEGALDPSDPDGLTNWSAQVRRRARELRKDQVAVPDVHEDVRGFFRRQRQERARRYAQRPSA